MNLAAAQGEARSNPPRDPRANTCFYRLAIWGVSLLEDLGFQRVMFAGFGGCGCKGPTFKDGGLTSEVQGVGFAFEGF